MAECFASLQVCGLRAARLATSGAPVPGVSDGYMSDSMMSVDISVETETGDDLSIKNGCGAICAAFKDCDKLKRVTLTTKFCKLDFELLELLTAAGLFVDGADTIGMQFAKVDDPCPDGACLELWTQARISGEQAVSTTVDDATYFHWVFPRTRFRPGNMTLDSGFLEVAIEGFGEENTQITADGPFNDWPTGVANGGGVTSMGGVFLDGPPPAAQCGYITVPATS